jgi:hypothetical protein
VAAAAVGAYEGAAYVVVTVELRAAFASAVWLVLAKVQLAVPAIHIVVSRQSSVESGEGTHSDR